MIAVYYTDKMAAEAQSFSPSAGKPRAVVASWRERFRGLEYIEPEPATPEQLGLAHDRGYVRGVLSGIIENGFGNRLPVVAAALPYTSGAMIAAATRALAGTVAVAPVSGFHHACYASGGGYCTFNGLIVAAQVLRQEDKDCRVGVLDFDEHYGNGTTDIVRHLNLNWIRHYSADAEWDAAEQAEAFLEAIPRILRSFAGCDVLLYQAGADPHVDDPLGGWLTTEQLRLRDRRVFDECKALGLPIAWNLAGGYQNPLRKVLDIHDNTMRECLAVFGANGI